MSLKQRAYLSLAVAMALGLWLWVLPSLSAVTINYPGTPEPSVMVSLPFKKTSHQASAHFSATFTLEHQPFQSTLIRIVPDDCLLALRIDNQALDLKTWTSDPVCYPATLTLDLAPYLKPGDNHIAMEFNDIGGDYGVDLKPLYGTCFMLLWVLALVACYVGCRHTCHHLAVACYQFLIANIRHAITVSVLLFFAVWLRVYVWDFRGGDFSGPLSGWLTEIQHFGMGVVYGHVFANYAPLYTYLLGIGDLFFPTSKLDAVKSISSLGDLAMAALVYVMVKRHGTTQSFAPIVAASLMLANPVSIANSASAGQCDVLYTFFLMATLYGLFLGRPLMALIMYGFAISFKLQAIFLAPFLLLYLLNRQIPWRFFWVPAAVYVITALPCWAQGRDMLSVLLVYWDQFNSYDAFGNVGNFYYNLRPMLDDVDPIVRNVGLMVTVIAASLFAYVSHLSWRQEERLVDVVLLASFCTALMPFLLPKMLDRYFFAADMFTLLLFCLNPRWWPIPLLMQAASVLVYPDFTFQLSYRFIPWGYETRQLIASLLHLVAILSMGWLCYRHIWHRSLPHATITEPV